MNITIKELTVKNFMSVGNATQAADQLTIYWHQDIVL